MSKRRGRGEGSIHQRPDGRWCALLDLGIVNGKRKRKYIYGATRKEVVEKLKAAQAAQATGADLAVERITVAQFLDRWIADVVSKRNKARTVDGYKQIIKDHLKPHLGRHQLDKLRPEHVQAMLNTLAAEGRKYNTVRNVRAALRRALNQAMRWQYVQRNVATLVDVPRYRDDDDEGEEEQAKPEFTIQPLDEEQARALLKAVAGHRLEVLYRIALSLGLRRGEVLGLRWKDIDFERATLRVTRLLQRVRGKLERGTTKTVSRPVASTYRRCPSPSFGSGARRRSRSARRPARTGKRTASSSQRRQAPQSSHATSSVISSRCSRRPGCRRRSASTTCATPAPRC